MDRGKNVTKFTHKNVVPWLIEGLCPELLSLNETSIPEYLASLHIWLFLYLKSGPLCFIYSFKVVFHHSVINNF